jgi:hypothetical protein
MNTLVYLVHGSRREYQLELTYSVLSAVHWATDADLDFRIALITDEKNKRPDLPVENVIFSSDEFADWTLNGQYHHQAKIHALSKALKLFKGKVALVDTDTHFKASPIKMFEQIESGRSVMYAYDGMLGPDRCLGPILERQGAESLSYQISSETRLFNSGVIGLDYSDQLLVEDVLRLSEQIYGLYPAFNTEQFAFSIVLDQRTSLSEGHRLVRHYYGYERGFIRAQIAELFPEFTAEAFRLHLRAFPKVGGYPHKRKLDLIKARLKAMVRREGAEYRFAYLSCLSALSCARSSPIHANIWAQVAVDMLRQKEFSIADIERDFHKMRRLETSSWPTDDTKRVWGLFWQEIASAREQGRVRATATSCVVSKGRGESRQSSVGENAR